MLGRALVRVGVVRRLLASLLLGFGAISCVRGQDPTVPAPTANPSKLAWTKLAPITTPRAEVAAAEAGGRIYVVGGFGESGATVPTVEAYDIASNSWSDAPDLPIAVNHPMAASAGGIVYVFGGYAGPGLDEPTDRAFALRDGRWAEIARMPEPRAAAGAAHVDGRIIVAGGVIQKGTERTLADTVSIYDPSQNRWSAGPGVPTGREHLGVASDGKRLFVVGGRTGGIGTNLKTTESFDPKTNVWTRLADQPTARGGSAASFAARFIVSSGGEADRTFDEAEALDVDSLTWISLQPLPTARHGLAVVGVGNIIYVIAGGETPGLSVSEANEAIDLSPLSR